MEECSVNMSRIFIKPERMFVTRNVLSSPESSQSDSSTNLNPYPTPRATVPRKEPSTLPKQNHKNRLLASSCQSSPETMFKFQNKNVTTTKFTEEDFTKTFSKISVTPGIVLKPKNRGILRDHTNCEINFDKFDSICDNTVPDTDKIGVTRKFRKNFADPKPIRFSRTFASENESVAAITRRRNFKSRFEVDFSICNLLDESDHEVTNKQVPIFNVSKCQQEGEPSAQKDTSSLPAANVDSKINDASSLSKDGLPNVNINAEINDLPASNVNEANGRTIDDILLSGTDKEENYTTIVLTKRSKKKHRRAKTDTDSDDDLPKEPYFPTLHPRCDKRFYNYLIEKMKPHYGIKTNREVVKVAQYVWKMVAEIESSKDAEDRALKIKEMKLSLARKRVVRTHFQFYCFCSEYLTARVCSKIIPISMLECVVDSDGDTLFMSISQLD